MKKQPLIIIFALLFTIVVPSIGYLLFHPGSNTPSLCSVIGLVHESLNPKES